jgi:cytochrome c oxidase subunit 4
MSATEHHIVPIRTNVVIYLLLLGLLVLTYAVAMVDLGPLGVPVALAIATVKAVIILMYFMHVKFSPPLIKLFSTAAFFWMIILLAFSFNDYWTRAWLAVLGK